MVFFGCAGIGASTGLVAYIFVAQTDYYAVSSPLPPAFFCAVCAVFIGWMFLSIFSFSSDAMLQSYLLDEELKFAGKNRPVEFAEFEQDFRKRQASCCACC